MFIGCAAAGRLFEYAAAGAAVGRLEATTSAKLSVVAAAALFVGLTTGGRDGMLSTDDVAAIGAVGYIIIGWDGGNDDGGIVLLLLYKICGTCGCP